MRWAFAGAALGVLAACRGGGSAGAEQPGGQDIAVSIRESEAGVFTEIPAAGMAVFEGEAQEIAPGVLMQSSAAIVASDPGAPATAHRVLWVRRITGSTGTGSVRFAADIPKNFAAHVDQLRVKILSDAPPGLDIGQLLGKASNLVGIAELVRQGGAQVIEEDPLVLILLAGAASISTTYVFFERPDVLGLTPRSKPMDIFFMNPEQRGRWVNERLLGEHCADLVASARDNNIPARLLANTILNEISDYGWEDDLQEIFYTGENRSHGWVQLQPRRVIEHGLIDFGTPASVRKPGVDLTDEELVASSTPQPGANKVTVRFSTNYAIWKRLNDPKPSIELAARELAYLLDRLKPGSPALANPWARALLVDPARGIDRNDIYANLKLAQASDPAQRQLELERSLAVLLIAAYNGGGAILDETDESRIFTAREITGNKRFPWEVPGDIDEFVIGADGQPVIGADGEPVRRYPYRDPRVHADNGGSFFPEVLRASTCLDADVPFPAVPTRFTGTGVSVDGYTHPDMNKGVPQRCESTAEWTITVNPGGYFWGTYRNPQPNVVETYGGLRCVTRATSLEVGFNGTYHDGRFELRPSDYYYTGTSKLFLKMQDVMVGDLEAGRMVTRPSYAADVPDIPPGRGVRRIEHAFDLQRVP